MNLRAINHRGTQTPRKAMKGPGDSTGGAGGGAGQARALRAVCSPCPGAPPARRLRLGAIALCAGAALLGGCRGERSDAPPRQFFPDMDDQARWDPQEQSRFYEDGRTMRQPPDGTVAYARAPLDPAGAGNADWAERFRLERASFLKDDDAAYYGGRRDENGQVVEYVATMPMPVTMAMLERGQERFNIYCSVCHGYTGDGKGMVGAQWSYALPSFHDPKYITQDPAVNQWRDGYLFHTARNGVVDVAGVQKMPGYAHALSEQDTWAIVAYIRALQRANRGSIQDVPPTPRQTLEQQRPAAMGAPPAPPIASTGPTPDQHAHNSTGGGQ